MLKALKKLFFDPQFARKKAFLKSLVLFQDLGDRELGLLVHALHSRTYHAGETVFQEGDIGRALFLLESGKVELTRQDPEGKPSIVYTIEPGEFFGEMAMLEQLPRTASASACEKSQLHLLYKSKLETLFHHQPRLGVAVLGRLSQLLSARLRRLTAAASGDASVPHA